MLTFPKVCPRGRACIFSFCNLLGRASMVWRQLWSSHLSHTVLTFMISPSSMASILGLRCLDILIPFLKQGQPLMTTFKQSSSCRISGWNPMAPSGKSMKVPVVVEIVMFKSNALLRMIKLLMVQKSGKPVDRCFVPLFFRVSYISGGCRYVVLYNRHVQFCTMHISSLKLTSKWMVGSRETILSFWVLGLLEVTQHLFPGPNLSRLHDYSMDRHMLKERQSS